MEKTKTANAVNLTYSFAKKFRKLRGRRRKSWTADMYKYHTAYCRAFNLARGYGVEWPVLTKISGK